MSFRGQPPLTIAFVLVGWVLLFSSGIRQLLTPLASVRMVRGRKDVVVLGASLGVVLIRIDDVGRLRVDRCFS